MKVSKRKFGEEGATLFIIENDNGYVLEATDFGARIVRLLVPTKSGELKNISLGFESEEEYRRQDTYFGATIGRVAGRLAKGQFKMGDQQQQFVANDGNNTLHGGPASFEEQRWETEIVQAENEIQLVFTHRSPDGTNGFAGNLDAQVIYAFNNQNEWRIDYQAETDKTTLYNPTNHVYFNLSGDLSQTVADHELFVNSEKFAVIDEESLPTGELRPVEGTPFEFNLTEGNKVGQGFAAEYHQTQLVGGYDHPFVLKEPSLEKLQAELKDQTSGISVKLYTDSPAVVIYTTNIGDGQLDMFGQTVSQHGGITLETQYLPDAINHQGFGSIILEPNQTFKGTTIFKLAND